MKKLIILIYIIIQVHNVFGQQPADKSIKYWFDIGIGNYITTNNSGGLNWNASINLINKKSMVYKIRYLNLEEFNLYGPSPSEKYTSGGIMIGKVYFAKYGHCAFLCGIGETGGIKRGKFIYENINILFGDGRNYESVSFSTVSIPLEVDLQYKPIKYIGIGTSFFCDLNLERPMCGFLFKIGLGRLR